jgi:DNA-binding response OmpR family regulator
MHSHGFFPFTRRKFGQTSNTVAVGPLVLDLGAHTAAVKGQVLELTSKEYAVLELLVCRSGRTPVAELS